MLVRCPAACGTAHSAALEGGTPGYPPLLSPPLPPHRPPVPGLLPSAAQRQRRKTRGARGGSRAGLTPWPPAAGAEAATRPASLKRGGEGSQATNTKGKLGVHAVAVVSCLFLLPPPFTSFPGSIFVLTAAFLSWGPGSRGRPDAAQRF